MKFTFTLICLLFAVGVSFGQNDFWAMNVDHQNEYNVDTWDRYQKIWPTTQNQAAVKVDELNWDLIDKIVMESELGWSFDWHDCMLKDEKEEQCNQSKSEMNSKAVINCDKFYEEIYLAIH